MLDTWRARARSLREQLLALYIAYDDPRTPWYAKACVALVLAYAFSPIDLIPDFIPVLGYLDDLMLVPLGIAMALRLIPAEVMADARRRAAEGLERPQSWLAAILIVTLWAMILIWLARAAWQLWQQWPET